MLVGVRGSGDLEAATGWHLRPEGLCRGDVCVPVRSEEPVEIWRSLRWPVAESGGDAYLGEPVEHRAAAVAGSVAPDFTLRDLEGREHSLSDQRGRKVVIASWAPW